MVEAKHWHHAITVPIGAIAGVYTMVEILLAKADELTEQAEIGQACLNLIQTILSVF